MPAPDILKKGVIWLAPKTPKILTALSCVGVGATAVLTANAVPKAQEAIAKAEVEKADEAQSEEIIPLTWKEKVKATWKIWIPPVSCGIATWAAIIGSSASSAKVAAANAALAGGYLAEKTYGSYDELKEAIIEKFGPEAYDELRNYQAEKFYDGYSIGDNPPADLIVGNVVPWATTVTGDQIVYLPESAIREAERRIFQRVETGEFVSANAVLDEIGSFRLIDAEMGEICGYEKETTGIFQFEIGTVTKNGVPCRYLIIDPPPKHRYYYGG